MNRFKKMVFTFDRTSDCYYSPDKVDPFLSRHRRASHIDKALERIDSGVTDLHIKSMKKTFTKFRHTDGCPASDL